MYLLISENTHKFYKHSPIILLIVGEIFLGETPDGPTREEDLAESVAELIAGCKPDSGGSSKGPESPGEAEFLKPGLEKVVTYCSSKTRDDVQVGPFFKADSVTYVKQGEVLYLHGELRDGRTGYYSAQLTDDGIQLVEAFGGPTETLCEDFEDIEIDGQTVPHLRVPEAGKTALKNPEGGMYTGKAHDTIKRDYSTHLEGVVYHVTDEGKEGYYQNGELCGRHNGMNTKSTIEKAGDEESGYKIFLIAENEAILGDAAESKEGDGDAAEGEEGAEKKKRMSQKVVDINTGDIKYADEEKCTDVVLQMIGRELCAVKTFGTEEEGTLEQAVRAENGDPIYKGVLQATVGTWFYCDKAKIKPVLRVYTPENFLVPLMRDGTKCFSKEPIPMEADDGPDGDGLYEIDKTLYMKIHLLKENPRDDDDKFIVVYRTVDMKEGFGGQHDDEVLSVEENAEEGVEGRPNTVKVQGITAKLFRNRATAKTKLGGTKGTIYWVGSNGMKMFGGEHWDDLKTIEWMYDAEGKKTEDSKILKHLVEIGGCHTVLDLHANAYFLNKDSKTPEDHDAIRDFWVLSYKKDGEERNVLVAEAEDPVSGGRKFKHFIRHIFNKEKRRETPSTYYLMDGTKADSLDALMKHLEAPDDAEIVNVKGFRNATVRTNKPRPTQRFKVVREGIDPKLKKMLDKAAQEKLDIEEAKRIAFGPADAAEGAGESLEATVESAGRAPEGQPPADAGVGGATVPDAPVEVNIGDAARALAEMRAEAEPSKEGEQPQGTKQPWMFDEPTAGGEGQTDASEEAPADDSSSQAASEQGPADDGSSQSGEGDSGQEG